MKNADKKREIENFIIWYSSDDKERETMFKCVEQYIKDDEEETTKKECKKQKTHLIKCDNDGYCITCGYQ